VIGIDVRIYASLRKYAPDLKLGEGRWMKNQTHDQKMLLLVD